MVALSGGADSVALLAAAAELAAAPIAMLGPRLSLRAIYVDHGLTAAAPLAAAAAAAAARLAVPLTTLSIEVPTGRGESVEAAARTARYAALAAALAPGECLLTAHHREDQAETLLLQLMRGAGLPGLAAMPAVARLGPGWLLRPLLDVPRAALRAYAEARGLPWHEDPMNADPRYDRAYLRTTLWPLLEARWPAAATTLARSAGHLAAAQRLLDEVSADYVKSLERGPALSVAGLKPLSPDRRAEVLRYWLRSRRLPVPPARRLALLADEVLAARRDGAPKLRLAGRRAQALRRPAVRVRAAAGARRPARHAAAGAARRARARRARAHRRALAARSLDARRHRHRRPDDRLAPGRGEAEARSARSRASAQGLAARGAGAAVGARAGGAGARTGRTRGRGAAARDARGRVATRASRRPRARARVAGRARGAGTGQVH